MKKSLEELMDLAEVLRSNGYDEVAEELESYLLSSRKESLIDIYVDGLIKRLREENPEVEEEDVRWDIEYVEGDLVMNNPKTDLARRLEGREDKKKYVWYKDVVKYEEAYLFYDNVLGRWMVRGYQFIWLSNIEKCEQNYNTYSYIKRWKWVKERLTRMPRVQDFTIGEWLKMLRKGWIDKEDLGFRKLIRYTREHMRYDCPTIEGLKKDIEEYDDMIRQYA